MNSRDIALNVLFDIESNNTFSNIALSKALRQNQFEDKQDRAFITRLVEGTTEYRITLDYVIDSFSKTKVKKCKPLIRCILRMGTYQIMYMDSVPGSAACNEMVKLTKKHGFAGLSGFVNGVLRSISRAFEQNAITFPTKDKNQVQYLSVKYSMPEWLVHKLIKDYHDKTENIIAALFQDRDTTIRVNELRTHRDELSAMLQEAGIKTAPGHYSEKALAISGYDFVRKIPGYRQGYFTVQDESSMCAIESAGIKPGDTVFDVCAAPGGKTTAAAEMLQGKGFIYSMDISEEKLSLIEENVERLGFDNVKILAHDATKVLTCKELGIQSEHDNDIPRADVVIADLPCSGLGIMGRKNDIKYRVQPEDLESLASLQRSILSVVDSYVKPGGTLLYSTCTINPDENEHNTAWFLEQHSNYKLETERLFLPGIDYCDGFYYAVMKKH